VAAPRGDNEFLTGLVSGGGSAACLSRPVTFARTGQFEGSPSYHSNYRVGPTAEVMFYIFSEVETREGTPRAASGEWAGGALPVVISTTCAE
jgi:hypothetical protein